MKMKCPKGPKGKEACLGCYHLKPHEKVLPSSVKEIACKEVDMGGVCPDCKPYHPKPKRGKK